MVEKQLVKGLAHITGGGFYENVPRMFNKPLTAVIDTQAWETPLIFQELQNLGTITFDEMFNIFNMGMGMVMAVSPENSEAVLSQLPDAVVIGKMAKQTTNDEVVHLLIKEEEA